MRAEEEAVRAEPARHDPPGSVDRGEESAGGLVEAESRVLPGRALTESCQPLHVSPDGSRIRLVLLRQRVGVGGLLPRQVESLHDRVDHLLARRAELLGGSPQEHGAIVVEVCVERRRGRLGVSPSTPRESTHPRAGAGSRQRGESPRSDVIRAHGAKQEQIQGQGGGADVAVPEDEPAEQSGVRSVGGIVETSVAVHEEQEHVSVSQIGAGRYPFGTIDAVLVSERQVPGRVIGHEVEHAVGQLVVVDSRVPRRGDRVDGPRFGAIREELMLVALLPLQPVVDRVRRDRRGQRSEVFGRRAGDASELLEAPVCQRRDLARTARVTRVRRRSALAVRIRLVSMIRSSVRFATSASRLGERENAGVPLVGWT